MTVIVSNSETFQIVRIYNYATIKRVAFQVIHAIKNETSSGNIDRIY